jgi:hypothetical protein
MENETLEQLTRDQIIYRIVYDQTCNLLEKSFDDWLDQEFKKNMIKIYRERIGGNEVIHGIKKK